LDSSYKLKKIDRKAYDSLHDEYAAKLKKLLKERESDNMALRLRVASPGMLARPGRRRTLNRRVPPETVHQRTLRQDAEDPHRCQLPRHNAGEDLAGKVMSGGSGEPAHMGSAGA
jgi:hypothetical protein